MLRRLLSVVLFLAAAPVAAQDGPGLLGIGRLFTNDYIGDGRDRWQSGSYVFSFMAGSRAPMGEAQPFFSLREYRLRSAIIASNGRGQAPGDRPYAGTLSFGVHSHFGQGTTQARLGADLTLVGPQTNVSRFQGHAHEVLNMRRVRFTEQQLPNDAWLGLSGELAEVMPLGVGVTLRPFGEVQRGPEDLVRLGADVFIGGDMAGDLLIRDVTTGHPYVGLGTAAPGMTFVLGADTALVADSRFLPGGDWAAPRDRRDRVRAGVHWRSEGDASVFYGLTYLGPEYAGQTEGQVTGSVRLTFDF